MCRCVCVSMYVCLCVCVCVCVCVCEQSRAQVGGNIQLSAHGTGAALPPVDEQVMKLQEITRNEAV